MNNTKLIAKYNERILKLEEKIESCKQSLTPLSKKTANILYGQKIALESVIQDLS